MPPERSFTLWTSRFYNPVVKERDNLIRVGIVLWRPRYGLGYDVDAYLTELRPDQYMMGLEDDAFTAAYMAKLDRQGVDVIRQRLDEIRATHGQREIVLLCYEHVKDPTEYDCHRQLFARWWEQKTGESIEELDDPGPKEVKRKKKKARQPSLPLG